MSGKIPLFSEMTRDFLLQRRQVPIFSHPICRAIRPVRNQCDARTIRNLQLIAIFQEIDEKMVFVQPPFTQSDYMIILEYKT